MKNKKGFTLVELLAVIAILAILMLLIMPNILNMFNKGKEDSFKVQVDAIKNVAEKQYQVDSMNGKKVTEYCYGEERCTEDMRLDKADKELIYSVKLDASGKVSQIAVQNNDYCYDERYYLKKGELSCTQGECKCNPTLPNEYLYWTKEHNKVMVKYNEKIPTAVSALSKLNLTQGDVYVRTVINGGTVIGQEMCLYYNNKSSCIPQGYWYTNEAITMNNLKTKMESELGVTATSCYFDDEEETATCEFGTSYCTLYQGGIQFCAGKNNVCETSLTKEYHCY